MVHDEWYNPPMQRTKGGGVLLRSDVRHYLALRSTVIVPLAVDRPIVMRLPILPILSLLALASTAWAQQAPEPCGNGWRSLFKTDSGVLVHPPEFQPVPVSGSLFDLIPRLDSTVQAESVSVVRFVLDTLGVATKIDVICAPSEVASERVAALIEDAEFSPAREPGATPNGAAGCLSSRGRMTVTAHNPPMQRTKGATVLLRSDVRRYLSLR